LPASAPLLLPPLDITATATLLLPKPLNKSSSNNASYSKILEWMNYGQAQETLADFPPEMWKERILPPYDPTSFLLLAAPQFRRILRMVQLKKKKKKKK
jgi:hypothetical protein